MKHKHAYILVFLLAATSLYADSVFTITVRGLRKDFPLLAWQMTYRINAASQEMAELQALEKARNDGCDATSAHIVATTVTLTPGNTRSVPPVIIIVPPQTQDETPSAPEPVIEYQEAYQAGYDHGITGFLTGRNNFVLNAEIPDKYREAEQGQAYKNGYARGFADEKAKAERRRPPAQRPDPPRQTRPHSNVGGAQNQQNNYR
jgi:hypothetical protein